MKSYLYVVIICLLTTSCKEKDKSEPIQTQEGYTISGSAPGLYNGLRAYLKSTNEEGYLKDQDTAIIINEAFSFEGKVEDSEAWFLEVNSLDGSFPFVIDNTNLTIKVDKNDIEQSKIQGDTLNNSIFIFNTELKQLNDSLNNISQRYREMIINKENLTGMSDQIADLKETILRFPHEFIKNNTDNPYGLVLLNTMIRRNTSDKGMIVESFDALNDDIKDSNLGKRVAKSMPEIRKEYDIIASTHIGKIAPNFSGPNPNGQTITLNDMKGKATLIHFWSSWFKASRRENKRLVRLYEKYHDKGMEMIGVSLDGSTSQTNPRSDWKKAIKEDQLIWNQISNLNYFNDTISRAYSVKSLPASFLLDANGVIVAKNLTGLSLEAKLDELLE